MKRFALLLFVLLAGNVFGQRLTIKEENDVFTGSDNSYTQGAEIEWMQKPHIKEGYTTRYGLSIRNVFYTPQDIKIAEPQPNDRPWAGLSALTLKQHIQYGDLLINQQFMGGAVGAWSYSEEIQTWFHAQIGSPKPMGWSNQIPNEVVVNWVADVIHPWYATGESEYLSADLAGLYGIALGNAFIYADGGVLARAGWNLPSHKLTIINPTEAWHVKPVAYIFGRVSGRAVAHNITINGSLFQDGPSQELEPFVTDYQYGVSIGVEGFKYDNQKYNLLISYAQTRRTEEFEGQQGETDFGTVIVGIGGEF